MNIDGLQIDIPSSRLQCKNHILFMANMAKGDSINDENGRKTIPGRKYYSTFN